MGGLGGSARTAVGASLALLRSRRSGSSGLAGQVAHDVDLGPERQALA